MTEAEVAAPAAPEAQELTEESLLKMASEFDSGKLGSEQEAEPLAPAGTADKPQEQAAETPKEPAAETPKTDESKPEAAPAKPDKAQREAERKERSWKKLEEEKAAFRAEQERLAKEKAELEVIRQKAAPPSEADTFDQIAAKYEAEGNDDYAKIARERAADIRRKESAARQEQEQAKFRDQFNKDYAELRDKDPDVGDPASETYQQMEALFKRAPQLAGIPNALQYAYDHVKSRQAAAAASGLHEEVKGYKQRISELEKKLALGGSFPSAPSGEKAFDQMTHEEQGKYLERQARSLDGD